MYFRSRVKGSLLRISPSDFSRENAKAQIRLNSFTSGFVRHVFISVRFPSSFLPVLTNRFFVVISSGAFFRFRCEIKNPFFVLLPTSLWRRTFLRDANASSYKVGILRSTRYFFRFFLNKFGSNVSNRFIAGTFG